MNVVAFLIHTRLMSYTIQSFLSLFPIAFLAAALLGCDSSDTPDGPHALGSGTITLGANTYEFEVIACDLTGESDQDYHTISAVGELPSGEGFDVRVSRNLLEDMLLHSITFYHGDIESGGGTVIETQRLFANGSWSNLYGDPNEPLIHIQGNTVAATATFAYSDDIDDTLPGSLEATCNQ